MFNIFTQIFGNDRNKKDAIAVWNLGAIQLIAKEAPLNEWFELYYYVEKEYGYKIYPGENWAYGAWIYYVRDGNSFIPIASDSSIVKRS